MNKKPKNKSKARLTEDELVQLAIVINKAFKSLKKGIASKKDIDRVFAMFDAISNRIAELHADIILNRRLYQIQLKNHLSPEEMKEFVKISKELEEGTLSEKLQN